ncbi:MAG TPA: hypothetical protein VF908_08975 [Gemmatimonadaceae bacterium]
MYDTQHRRGHADPDRERDNRDNREHRLSRERPETEAQILHQNVQKITGDRFAAFFFEPLLSSELDPRTTLGFPATQSRTFQIIRPKLDVCAKFFLQFVLRLGSMKESRR